MAEASINIDKDGYLIDMIYRYFSAEKYSNMRKAILSEAVFHFKGKKIHMYRKSILKLFYKTRKRLDLKTLNEYKIKRKTFDYEMEEIDKLTERLDELKIEPVTYKTGFLLADATVVDHEPPDRPSHEVEISEDGTLHQPKNYKRNTTTMPKME